MFKHKTVLRHQQTCAFCGRKMNPGHVAVVDYTLRGRLFYHQICRYDMELADRYGFARVSRTY